MKHLKKISLAVATLAFFAVLSGCGSGIKGDRIESGEAQEEQMVIGEKRLVADLEHSNIEWVGSKPGGQHNGIIMLNEGVLELSDGNIVGGSFEIDMKSIKVLDLTDPDANERLRLHLESNDFFGVDSFPTAMFVITGVEAKSGDGITHQLTGNLTIRGITRSISFYAGIDLGEGVLTATTPQFVINRAEWNVRYGSKSFFKNLKDNFINDDIGLKINLKATL